MRWKAWLPWLVLAAVSVFWLARWPTFPLALDPAYHLSIARQMQAAGGVLAYEWWEAAPVGRPHLYPPVIHLLLTPLLALGLSPLFILRFFTVAVVPAVLLTVYATTTRLGRREAAGAPDLGWACLLACLVPFTWFLQIGEALASGFALIELLWLLVAVRERCWRAASCLMALLWYTHLGMPWIALAALGWALLFKAVPEPRRAVRAIGWGTVAALPWLLHLAFHLASFQIAGRLENSLVEINPLLVFCAAFGAWHAWRMRDAAGRLLVALWLGSVVLAFPFLFRWVSGEGVVPVCLLAGYGAAGLADRWAGSRAAAAARWSGMTALLVGLWLSPTLVIQRQAQGWTASASWLDSAPFHLANEQAGRLKSEDIQIYGPHLERLAQRVRQLTQPGEILWSNAAYAGGLMAALAQRPTSSAMFYEVQPARAFDPVAAAQWVIWFKIDLPGMPRLPRLIARYGLTLVADEPLALIYRRREGAAPARPPRAAVPLWAAGMLLWTFLGVSIWQLRQRKDYALSNG